MKASFAMGLLMAATSSLAAPTTNYSPNIQACLDAPNCETWVNPVNNRTQIRFKKGMGPDSEWYHKNVRLLDPMYNKALEIRESDGKKKPKHKYNSDRSKETQSYGFQKPIGVAASMKQNCEASSCENIKWSIDSSDGFNPITISITGGGQWDSTDPHARDNFIKALVDSASYSHRHCVTHGGSGAGVYEHDWSYTAMNYLDINRYFGPNLHGFASLTVSVKEDVADACEVATGILDAASGAVSEIGGGFFGVVGALTCGISSASQETVETSSVKRSDALSERDSLCD